MTNPTQGLTDADVEKSRAQFGKNVIEEIRPATFFELIIDSIKEPMMVLLLTICGLSFLFKKEAEALFMVFVVFAYIGVECINKSRSNKALTKLRTLTRPVTKVKRSGKVIEIPTSDIVVGDIVLLYEGIQISADATLLDSTGLLVNEAPITGESQAVQKENSASLYAGAEVLAGEGKGVVVAVGRQSHLGSIAHEVQRTSREKTGIQEAMTHLAKVLAGIAIVGSMIIPLIGFFRGQNGQEMVVTWLALTFLMVPGQPPVIITMALALASFELAFKKMVVSRLRGVEVLGSVTAIVSDKTGTITENKMEVEYFILANGERVTKLEDEVAAAIFKALPEYCNDPTDIAVSHTLGAREKTPYRHMQSISPLQPWRVVEYEDGLFFAGQCEKLIEFSSASQKEKTALLQAVAEAAALGKRVVGYASLGSGFENLNFGAAPQSRKSPKPDPNEEAPTFLAVAVLSDPVRPQVAEAIQTLQGAGISTYMVTGDHGATAQTIARAINLPSSHVVARALPEQKVELVEALKAKKETVAVIGDGINDAPAIRCADVGIAMGQIGTDIAKECADIILTDDNFVHLPEAIAIGRKALHNFRKGLTYYLTAKAILLFIFLVPLFLAIPFPFHPIHIIMIELLMDLASSTIFVTEAIEPNEMAQPAPDMHNFLRLSLLVKIAKNGLPLGCGILSLYLWVYYGTHDVQLAQTTAFVAWLLGHILLALNLKQESITLFQRGFFANRFGLFWLIGMVLLSLTITQIPFLYPIMHTTAIPLPLWGTILCVLIPTTFWLEFRRRL